VTRADGLKVAFRSKANYMRDPELDYSTFVLLPTAVNAQEGMLQVDKHDNVTVTPKRGVRKLIRRNKSSDASLEADSGRIFGKMEANEAEHDLVNPALNQKRKSACAYISPSTVPKSLRNVRSASSSPAPSQPRTIVSDNLVGRIDKMSLNTHNVLTSFGPHNIHQSHYIFGIDKPSTFKTHGQHPYKLPPKVDHNGFATHGARPAYPSNTYTINKDNQCTFNTHKKKGKDRALHKKPHGRQVLETWERLARQPWCKYRD